MNETPKYDSFGVVITLNKRGKYDVHRVFVRNGKVAESIAADRDRTLSYALKEAHEALDKSSTRLQRGEFAFTPPPAPKLKVEQRP